jgi:hypothetical protein
MRRELAVTVVALIAACTQEGSTASGQTSESTPAGLAAFHLAQSGDGRVSFGGSSLQGNVQEYSDVVFRAEKGTELRAETLRIAGARETADGPVFDTLEILGLVGEADGEIFTLDRIYVEEPNALFASIVSRAFSVEGLEDDEELGAFTDYAFETFAIEGFGTQSDSGAVAFENIRLTDLSGGKLGGFLFEGLTGAGDATDATAVAFSLGSWSMNGLDLSGVDSLSDADLDDPEELQAALLESGLNDPFVKHYDDYAVEDLRIDIDGVIVALDSAVGEARQTRVGVETEDTLSRLTVEFDGDKDLGAQALEGFALFGYERFEINGRFVQLADQVQDRLVTDEYALQAEDAFELELDYDFGGVGAYMAAAAEQGFGLSDDFDPEDMMEVLGALVLNGFELRLIDDSIVERSLQAAAAMQGQTPEQVREQAIALMTVGAMMAPPGAVQALVAESITAAGTFLTEPGTLRVTLAPDAPVAVSELIAAFESEDYELALAMLNIEVAAD